MKRRQKIELSEEPPVMDRFLLPTAVKRPTTAPPSPCCRICGCSYPKRPPDLAQTQDQASFLKEPAD